MKSLKELIKSSETGLTDKSDITIIKEYLSQPEILEKAPEILVDILQGQINRYVLLRRQQLTWGTMSFDYYYDDFPKDIASEFVHLTLKVIAAEEFNTAELKWIQENVPKLKLKQAFYVPLLDELNGLGYRFQNQTDENFQTHVDNYKRHHGIW